MIIAATGHRPDKLGGYSDSVFNALVSLAIDYLAHQQDVDYVISGMALGWDQAFAYGAEIIGINFVAAVPFRGQENQWPQKSQERYRQLLSFAHKIVYVSGGGYAASKMHARNEWMVDRADKIVALWNGSRGGAGACLSYAQAKSKPVDLLWQKWVQKYS